MGISIDVGDESQQPPTLSACNSLSSSEASVDDLEGGNCDSLSEDCFSPEDGQKIKSKFISTGTGNAEFLRRQSQMGKLSLRRKSDLRLPIRNESSSSAYAEEDKDFMKRLSAINSICSEEKPSRQKSIDRLEQGLPLSRSSSPTPTSNKDKFLQHLRSTMSSRRSSSFRKSPTTQAAPKATTIDRSLPETIQFYPIEDIEACCEKPTRSATSEFKLTTYFSIKQLLIIPILLIVGLAVVQNYKMSSLQSQLSVSVASRDHLQKTYGTLVTELHKYKDTHEKMKQVNNDLSSHTKKLREDYLATQSELDKLRKTEKAKTWSEVRLSKVIQGVQEWSRKRVLEKFGKGPYRVELQLLLPTSKNPQFIKLELAPLDLMPHAVSTFLEQVEQKLWDGQTFDVHAGHVLLARPDPANTNAIDDTEGEVPTVMFAEYNEEYPHEKYTVGFPARPNSGQDFYINLQSNVAHHSPRFVKDETTGEEQFIEGEPCFGKIIDQHSKLVVDEMDKLRVGKGGILDKKVVIVSARLIGR